MFTMERDSEGTIITLLDTTAENEDVLVILHDVNKVALAQWDEDQQGYLGIFLTYDMLKDMIRAMDLPEGLYQREETKGTT